jgi:hypothetical protein
VSPNLRTGASWPAFLHVLRASISVNPDRQWANFEPFDNIPQAKLSVFQHIDTFYNSRMIHQTLEC